MEQTVEMLAARAATKGIELICDVPRAGCRAYCWTRCGCARFWSISAATP